MTRVAPFHWLTVYIGHVRLCVCLSLANTMSPGPRPISVPGGILNHPTVWSQYTNITDWTEQTGRDNGPMAERTVLQTVAQKPV